MRVLLIATNRERFPFPVSPLGVIAVAAAAIEAGIEVELLDMMFQRDPAGAIRRALKGGAFHAIGLGIRNLDNCFYAAPHSFYEEVKELVEEARRWTDAPLILGGSGFSVEPQGWLSRLDVDYGVVGEGEEAFVRLLGHIEAGRSPRGEPGIISPTEMRELQAATGERKPRIPVSYVPDIRTIPTPAHHLLEYRRYEAAGSFVSVQAKRGCAFKCQYCVYPQLEGTAYRNRPPEAIVEEIAQVHKDQGARRFFFSDSVFNAPRRHCLELCELLARCGLPIQWMAYTNSARFDDELAQAMAASGCLGVEFGLDGVTEKMLHNWRKPFHQPDIQRSLQACADHHIPFAVHLLFGGPGETIEDIVESQRYLDSCARPHAVFASLGIRIYEGAPIVEIAREEGVISEEDDLFFPTWYLSPGLGADPIGILDRVATQREEWSTATDWNKWSMRLIQKLITRYGQQPSWLNIANYGRWMRRPLEPLAGMQPRSEGS